MVASYLDTVIDTPDCRRAAEFYRRLLDLRYPAGSDLDADWLVLEDAGGRRVLAFQQVADFTAPTWPDPAVPQQLHLDCTVPDEATLHATKDEAVAMGGRLLYDRSDHRDEPLFVLADPDGHPFCIFVHAPAPGSQ